MISVEDPVSVALERLDSERSIEGRLGRLVQVLELRLRLDALLLAANHLRLGMRGSEHLGVLLQKRSWQLGDWYRALQVLTSTVHQSPLDPICRWFNAHERQATDRPLAKALNLRNTWIHSDGRFSESFQDEALAALENLVLPTLQSRPVIGPLEVRLGRVFLEGSEVTGWPLLAPGEVRVSGACSLLMLAGCKAPRLRFGSVHGEEQVREDAWHAMVQGLRTGSAATDPLRSDTTADVIHARLASIARRFVGTAVERRQYGPSLSIDRADADEMLRAHLDGSIPLLFLTGPSGIGRTTWICRAVERRLAAGAAVLSVSGSRLSDQPFPEALREVLGAEGSVGPCLDHATALSPDGRVLVALDGLPPRTRGAALLRSLKEWADREQGSNSVRVVLACRPDELHGAGYDSAVISTTHHQFALRGLSDSELLELVDVLEGSPGTRAARLEFVERIGTTVHESWRRPGFILPVLTSIGKDVPDIFSPLRIHEACYRHDVLDLDGAGRARRPGRGQLVRAITEWLKTTGRTDVPLDQPIAAQIGLLDRATGERAADLDALIDGGILIESCENFSPFVAFSDPRFQAFVTSLGHPCEGAALISLRRREDDVARTAAAFLLIRMAQRNLVAEAVESVIALDEEGVELVLDALALDGPAVIGLAHPLAHVAPHRVSHILNRLFDSGEVRLADAIARSLKEKLPDSPLQLEVRQFLLRAAYELDDYERGLELIATTSEPQPPEFLALRALIEVSRGMYEESIGTWRRLLEWREPGTAAYGSAMAGLGYALGRAKEYALAERHLREAIEVLSSVSGGRILAEALGDLGQLLCEQGRFQEAQLFLSESLTINRRSGLLAGQAIVLGLLGELDLRRERWAEARSHLEDALSVARRTGNQWRQGWTLARLARIEHALGRPEIADRLNAEAIRIRTKIGASDVWSCPE